MSIDPALFSGGLRVYPFKKTGAPAYILNLQETHRLQGDFRESPPVGGARPDLTLLRPAANHRVPSTPTSPEAMANAASPGSLLSEGSGYSGYILGCL